MTWEWNLAGATDEGWISSPVKWECNETPKEEICGSLVEGVAFYHIMVAIIQHRVEDQCDGDEECGKGTNLIIYKYSLLFYVHLLCGETKVSQQYTGI